jgi:Fic family protein
MGRLWQTLILMQQYPVFEYLPVEALIKQKQAEYYHTLSESDNAGNSTPFIEFMLGIILESLQELLQSQNKTLYTEDRIFLFGRKKTKNSAGKTICRTSEAFLLPPRRDLKWAVEQGILLKSGEQRLTEYWFKE